MTFFKALFVVTKNHPHMVVKSTNKATSGGDKAPSAQIHLIFSRVVVTSDGFGGERAFSAKGFHRFPVIGGDIGLNW